ncbi:hypothetical protein K3495_g4734 [Podosphaera aphanis]|nr:hypothetical protein K3495_g4734 [Podosphaera aphanis]
MALCCPEAAGFLVENFVDVSLQNPEDGFTFKRACGSSQDLIGDLSGSFRLNSLKLAGSLDFQFLSPLDDKSVLNSKKNLSK